MKYLLTFFVFLIYCFLISCSKSIPENWPECPPSFKPDSLLPYGIPNDCQFVYEGFFDLAKNQSEVNCIKNPTNWILEEKAIQGNSYFEISVFHNPIAFEDLAEGGKYGLCIRNLIFVDENKNCGDHHQIERRCVGVAGGDRSFIGLHLPPEFWECYEDGLIEFRVTSKMKMPIVN